MRGTVKIRRDGTEIWCAKRLIEPDEFWYSCMSELPDGKIGILYEGKNLVQKFVKFSLEWLLEGKD